MTRDCEGLAGRGDLGRFDEDIVRIESTDGKDADVRFGQRRHTGRKHTDLREWKWTLQLQNGPTQAPCMIEKR